jgi:hypothetical protein
MKILIIFAVLFSIVQAEERNWDNVRVSGGYMAAYRVAVLHVLKKATVEECDADLAAYDLLFGGNGDEVHITFLRPAIRRENMSTSKEYLESILTTEQTGVTIVVDGKTNKIIREVFNK